MLIKKFATRLEQIKFLISLEIDKREFCYGANLWLVKYNNKKTLRLLK